MSSYVAVTNSEKVEAPRTSVIVDGGVRDIIPAYAQNAEAKVAHLVAKYEAAGHTVTTLTWVPKVLTQAEQTLAYKNKIATGG